MNTQTILRSLKCHIDGYISRISRQSNIDYKYNRVDFSINYPTDDQFQSFIFNTMNEMGLTVYMDEESPYKMIYLIKDGFKMPVIVHFNMENNIYAHGNIGCSVWINEYIKEPVEGE